MLETSVQRPSLGYLASILRPCIDKSVKHVANSPGARINNESTSLCPAAGNDYRQPCRAGNLAAAGRPQTASADIMNAALVSLLANRLVEIRRRRLRRQHSKSPLHSVGSIYPWRVFTQVISIPKPSRSIRPLNSPGEP